jgi:hypothetical protein
VRRVSRIEWQAEICYTCGLLTTRLAPLLCMRVTNLSLRTLFATRRNIRRQRSTERPAVMGNQDGFFYVRPSGTVVRGDAAVDLCDTGAQNPVKAAAGPAILDRRAGRVVAGGDGLLWTFFSRRGPSPGSFLATLSPRRGENNQFARGRCSNQRNHLRGKPGAFGNSPCGRVESAH